MDNASHFVHCYWMHWLTIPAFGLCLPEHTSFRSQRHTMAQQIERNQEATVYIGNLDERCTDSLVWELMLQAGPVGTFEDMGHSVSDADDPIFFPCSKRPLTQGSCHSNTSRLWLLRVSYRGGR